MNQGLVSIICLPYSKGVLVVGGDRPLFVILCGLIFFKYMIIFFCFYLFFMLNIILCFDISGVMSIRFSGVGTFIPSL